MKKGRHYNNQNKRESGIISEEEYKKKKEYAKWLFSDKKDQILYKK